MGIELLIILTTMSNKKKRFILPEEEIPQYWYNIQADMVNKPMPPLHPGTKQPLKAEDLYPIFAEELCRQELNQTDTWIEIPEEVREMYKYYRSTPLEIMNRECANQTSIHLYCTGSYWVAFERSAYQLRRAFPDSEITPMRLYAYPFPVVMVSVTDRSLRLYERKHIAKQNGADYKLLTVPELSAPAYQAWHSREVKGLPALN